MSNLTPEALEARRKYHREHRKRYFEEHPEAKQKQLEATRRWRANNKEHCAAYMRKWKAEHPEHEQRFFERKAAEYGITDTAAPNGNGIRVNDKGWIICPHCGCKTKTKITPRTVLIEFPLFCPRCKTETVISRNKTE